MKKWQIILLSGAIISALGLAACGNSEKTNQNKVEKSENDASQRANDNQKVNEADGETTDPDTPVSEEVTDSEQSENPGETNEEKKDSPKDEQTIRQLEQNLNYTVNDEEKQDTAFLSESDNQKFSMYVLPKYELTAEEPNKDIVFLKDNDRLFMRIELIGKDHDWQQVVQTSKEQLAAVNQKIETVQAPTEGWLKDAEIYNAKNTEDSVSAYLIPSDKTALKITVFDDINGSQLDAFLKMAETIQAK
ncbi:hypothetical protein J2S13_001237 [Oikeobacillus pervagus]|uniref:Lipoprotein n=1 Tax=Oikeobacillus pervagus TaxID=1325931 RepID=A0AAJ1SY07_9BACI|nr:hypothetical protein [Oikeobacillus pervagus]MDQ0214840.1 hypothetical protein [Oikeobacillus pervagus]